MKKIIFPLCTLSSTVIGVGIFSLPYITSTIGIWTMLGYFLVLGALVVTVHLFFSELALKTPDYKRLPGFAGFYLGKIGKNISLVSAILGMSGAILAYLIVGGGFLTNLLSPILGGNNLFYTLLYFALGASLIFFGIKAICKIEFWGLILFILTLFLIFAKGIPFLKIENLLIKTGGISNIFLPYGPVLFTLWGASLIPEVEEMLGNRKDLLKKTVFFAIFISVLIYFFFIFSVLGITGSQTTESALTGLRNFLGEGIVNLGLFFGIITTFTSFLAIGLTLKKVFWYDLKINKNLSWLITCFFPLVLFLIGLRNFIPVISFVGGTTLGIDGILILLMYKKVQKKNIFIILPLILILFGGIIYEILYFLK
jgi:tyrosine-specific transport protein